MLLHSSSTTTMPSPTPLPLTLIVAATRNLGIGRAGTLPWPSLKGEMGYFARVTKRAPTGKNAVVMGRKTWESIPSKFRPLKGRINVVISSTMKPEETDAAEDGDEIIIVRSLEEGLTVLAGRRRTASIEHQGDEQAKDIKSTESQAESHINNIFIIGGATIYKAALDLPPTFLSSASPKSIPLDLKVLLTRIYTDFECDTFFPLDPANTNGWEERSRGQLETFVGEQLGDEVVVKEKSKDGQEVEYEFCLFQRR